MKPLTREWIKKAENDYLVSRKIFELEQSIFDAVSFHSQQCVEKYLKAVLQENVIPFEKTHNLGYLLDLCKDFVPELLNYELELKELSNSAVEIRYPGSSVSRQDAQTHLASARTVRRIIRRYFRSR